MSESTTPATAEARRGEVLEDIYAVHEELQLIADSDCGYAEYAENWLQSLREVGYDV